MNKFILISSLWISMVFCTACGGNKNKLENEKMFQTEETEFSGETDLVEETVETAVEIDHTQFWSWENGIYKNSFIGIEFETFDGWSQFSDRELLELQEADYAGLNSVLKEQMKQRVVYAGFSQSQNKDSVFSVCYEKKTSFKDLNAYTAEYKKSAELMFKDAELLFEGDVDFCDNVYWCIEFSIYTSYNGGGYIRRNVYIREVDDYFVTITLTADPFGNESIEEMVSRCK